MLNDDRMEEKLGAPVTSCSGWRGQVQLIMLMRKTLMQNWRKSWCTRYKLWWSEGPSGFSNCTFQTHSIDLQLCTLQCATVQCTLHCSVTILCTSHTTHLSDFVYTFHRITTKVANFDWKVFTPHSAVLSMHIKCILQILPFWMYDLMHFTSAVGV